MKTCRDCGGTSVERDEHHYESLDVCLACGSSAIDQQFHSFRVNNDPRRRPRGGRVQDPRHRQVLPLQLQGHVQKRTTGPRRECERQLREAVDRLKLLGSGSVANEARYLLSKVKLEGKAFRKECVVAACVFVAQRTHQDDTSMLKVTEMLEVDLAETNRVVKHLAQLDGLRVQARAFPRIEEFTKRIFAGCEFWKSDGSAVDNEGMLRRVNQLVTLLGRVPVSNVYLSENFAVASAYLIYKSEDLRTRGKMSLIEFGRDCSVDFVSAKNMHGITKGSQVIVRCLKKLLQKLPYVCGETKSMKCHDVLRYLEDVEKHKELLVEDLQVSASPAFPVKMERMERNGESVINDETLDEDEIDSYIRTEREVALLKPLYEKVHQFSL